MGMGSFFLPFTQTRVCVLYRGISRIEVEGGERTKDEDGLKKVQHGLVRECSG
jgi:hypothetical protein